jgi:hypothetical protein
MENRRIMRRVSSSSGPAVGRDGLFMTYPFSSRRTSPFRPSASVHPNSKLLRSKFALLLSVIYSKFKIVSKITYASKSAASVKLNGAGLVVIPLIPLKFYADF